MLQDSEFQLTLPMRGAIFVDDKQLLEAQISTHTPHAGSDHVAPSSLFSAKHFNSHSPCGERSSVNHVEDHLIHISTHTPHAGSDLAIGHLQARGIISTHTPHAGSDITIAYIIPSMVYFNSHSPCGERSVIRLSRVKLNRNFNSHSPCGER